MKYAKVKGTDDFYPEDKAVQSAVFKVLKEVSARYGFQEVETPAMESVALLTAKSGEETISQIFTLDKRGKEELGLRFDLTIPITRMFVEKQRELPNGTKWFALSRMWRYERPQKGRLREFYQLSAELFGSDKPLAVAECINLLIACLEGLGATSKDVVVKVNNRKLLEGIITQIAGANQFENVTRIIDKKSKISDDAFLEELGKLGLSKEQASKLLRISSITGNLDTVKESLFNMFPEDKLGPLAREGLYDLEEMLKALPEEYLEVDLSIARGLAYYTGAVFECFDRKGKFRAIAGGGQYNGLTKLLGGQDCAAVGFGLGYSTLLLLLKEIGKVPLTSSAPEFYVASPDKFDEFELDVIRKMRKWSSVEIDVTGRSFTKQLAAAQKLGAKKFIVLGSDEQRSGKVNVKNLATRDETEVSITDLIKE